MIDDDVSADVEASALRAEWRQILLETSALKEAIVSAAAAVDPEALLGLAERIDAHNTRIGSFNGRLRTYQERFGLSLDLD